MIELQISNVVGPDETMLSGLQQHLHHRSIAPFIIHMTIPTTSEPEEGADLGQNTAIPSRKGNTLIPSL